MDRNVIWLDPSLENVNAGDEIIADAVGRNLSDAERFPRFTTHRRLNRSEVSRLRAADVALVGGTNIINSRLLIDRQWPMPPWQVRALLGKLVFVGSGWWQYQRAPDPVTSKVFRALSHPSIPHAVRDNYTANRLRRMGIEAVMTGCPTMWGLDGVTSHLRPGQEVVATTMTDYYVNSGLDAEWLRILSRHYGEVHMIGMGPGDEAAFASLGEMPRVRYSGYGAEGLARAREHTQDLIGTRLHAAVRWLQLGGGTLVLSVDNRATEIGKDTGLPTVERADLSALQTRLTAPRADTISMPTSDISDWKKAWRAGTDG